MKPLSGCVLALVLGIASFASASALQEKTPADQDPRLAPIAKELAAMHELLAAQTSLSLIAFEHGRVEKGFGHDDSPNFLGTIQLLYKGARFLYSYEFSGGNGRLTNAMEGFDGELYTDLNRQGDGTYTRSTVPFKNDVVMCQRHELFTPFIFLQSKMRLGPYAQLSYLGLTNKADWTGALSSLPAEAAIDEPTVDDHPCIRITHHSTGTEPSTEDACYFDVYFARDLSWFPVKWERRAPETGTILSSYFVEKLEYVTTGTGARIPYPGTAVLKHYAKGKLRDTERIELKKIDFNTVTDAELAVDPAQAATTRDLDGDGKFHRTR